MMTLIMSLQTVQANKKGGNMINIKSISNMYNEEIDKDIELREELLQELKHYTMHINGYNNIQDAPTHVLFEVYKLIKEM